MIVIDFAVMQFAEESLVDDRFGREKLAGVTALETHARFHAGSIDRPFYRHTIFPRKRQRLLDDDVFAGLRGSDDLRRVLVGITAD